MARSWQWFAGVHALLTMAIFIEEHGWDSQDFINMVDGASAVHVTVCRALHAIGGLVLGVIFDRLGAPVALVAANASSLAWEVSNWLGLFQLSPFLRVLAHPHLVPCMLLFRRSSGEVQVRYMGRAYMNLILAMAVFKIVHVPLVFVAGKVIFGSLPLLSVALGLHLCRAAPDADLGAFTASKRPAGAAPAGDAVDVESPTAREPDAAPLAAAASWMQGDVWRILSRSDVIMAFALEVAMMFVRQMSDAAVVMALVDPSQVHLSGETYNFTRIFTMFLILCSWTFLPAMYVGRFGPVAVMQVLLAVTAAVSVADAVLCLLPAGASSLGAGLLVNLSFLPFTLARDGADFTAAVFLVTVVEPQHRGALWGLKSTLGVRGQMPFPTTMLAGWLYKFGGLSVIFCLNSCVCLAMVVLFRKSALMHVRLKES